MRIKEINSHIKFRSRVNSSNRLKKKRKKRIRKNKINIKIMHFVFLCSNTHDYRIE